MNRSALACGSHRFLSWPSRGAPAVPVVQNRHTSTGCRAKGQEGKDLRRRTPPFLGSSRLQPCSVLRSGPAFLAAPLLPVSVAIRAEPPLLGSIALSRRSRALGRGGEVAGGEAYPTPPDGGSPEWDRSNVYRAAPDFLKFFSRGVRACQRFRDSRCT